MCSAIMKYLLFFAAVLQYAAAGGEYPPASEIDWRKTRPASLLAEVGSPDYTETTEEDFELVKEPIIIRFDRDWSSSDVSKRVRCPTFTGEGDTTAEHQLCLCYYSEGIKEDGDYLKCGANYAALCTTSQYADIDVFAYTGKVVIFRTGRIREIPPFTIQEKVGDDGNIVPMIRMKKAHEGCGLVYVENVYKQGRLHDLQEVEDYLNSLTCPPCAVDNCDAQLDDGIDRYSPVKNDEPTPEPQPQK